MPAQYSGGMSTIDPQVAEAERLERQRTSGVGATVVVILALVHAGLWGLAAWGLVPILGLFQQMALDPYSIDAEPDIRFVLFFVGLIPGAVLGFVLTARAARLIPLGAAVLLPFATAFAGIAIALLVSLSDWAPVAEVGFSPGFLDSDAPTEWGPLQWVAYRMPVILPLAFGVLALLVALLVVSRLVAGSGRRRVAAALLRSGTRVYGQISESTFTGTVVMGAPVIRFTTAYQDALGTPRWVTKKGTFAPTEVPAAGQRVTVWYDPSAPSDEKRIMVALGEHTGSPPPPGR